MRVHRRPVGGWLSRRGEARRLGFGDVVQRVGVSVGAAVSRFDAQYFAHIGPSHRRALRTAVGARRRDDQYGDVPAGGGGSAAGGAGGAALAAGASVLALLAAFFFVVPCLWQ